ncbi:MAG: response regulator [Erysipelotrichaceae bacterium]|nr:response regulator [Erysipelotrichaceae bacterium]
MTRGYALVTVKEEGQTILFQTESFDVNDLREKISFSKEMELWISGDDQQYEDTLKLLNEAREENQAKETFLSNMSHDIRTPMNAIIGLTSLAKNHLDEKARVADSLNKIEVASGHLLSLINEVLDMSRINSGRLSINEEQFWLSDLLHETLTVSKPQMAEKQHHFTFKTDNILYESLYGDTLRLRQIFVNIINNSVKYTPDHGEIEVSFSQEMQDERCVLCFRCQDNGIGMSEEFLKKVFDPFERANSTTISRIEGTGLGMSIVKKLVETMNGTISIQSKLNEGTTVEIRIPLRYEKAAVNDKALKNRNILVLENDKEVHDRILSYLQEYDLSFKETTTFNGAISLLTDSEFANEKTDVLLLGEIGEATGDLFDVASYLHKAHPEMTIILVGDQDWNDIEYRANRSGIEHFIPLPLFRKSLINGIAAALKDDSHDHLTGGLDLSGKRILLVEDNFINREIAKEILSSTKVDLDTAENGQEALDKYLSDTHYDAILMDVQMPLMNGYEATKAIRSSGKEDAKTIRIFAMTANTFAEDVAKAKEAGMDSHIAKPIDVHKLMQTLKTI